MVIGQPVIKNMKQELHRDKWICKANFWLDFRLFLKNNVLIAVPVQSWTRGKCIKKEELERGIKEIVV